MDDSCFLFSENKFKKKETIKGISNRMLGNRVISNQKENAGSVMTGRSQRKKEERNRKGRLSQWSVKFEIN